MISSGFSPVYKRTRGGRTESVHFGAFVIADIHGNIVASAGDPELCTFIRSTAKPFQAIPFVEAGGPAHFNLTEKELALICASHTGTKDHVETAASIQMKIGVDETDLACGVHPPFDRLTWLQMQKEGCEPSTNHNNCSGKHSGMLAFARLNGWPTDQYLSPVHPVQQHILATFAEMSELSEEQLGIGVDGCSAPNFALPLFNGALAFAHMADPSSLSENRAAACRQIVHAMNAHPEMVAGPGELDTHLMRAACGSLFSKGGAEGYQGIGVLPGAIGKDSPALGITLKISDGDPGSKVRAAVTLELLKRLGVLSDAQMEDLSDFGPEKTLKNSQGLVVGSGKPIGMPENFALVNSVLRYVVSR